MKKDKMNILICFWNAIGIVIIAGFLLYSLIVCGSASLGYCEDNTYFLGNHGEYTQVSEIIYHVSYVWEILFWIFYILQNRQRFITRSEQLTTDIASLPLYRDSII